jgi:hypothetical protein
VVTCPARIRVQTGLFSSVEVVCEGKHKEGRPHGTKVSGEICRMLGIAKGWIKWL